MYLAVCTKIIRQIKNNLFSYHNKLWNSSQLKGVSPIASLHFSNHFYSLSAINVDTDGISMRSVFASLSDNRLRLF